ncbi:MAG: hypothetical protein E6Q95_02805 [Chitinophagaceae bacterium]|nr:MAG: hypothetical protein E6Q95_02805 [Chitinophagaceae bacterium]
MKLAQTLAKYLEINKKLSLPGLGSFSKNNDSIELTPSDIKDFDDNLIDFIMEDTGKMKVLAISDINSQWNDVLQFLNTGKPYTLSGLGTLIKNQKGDYHFQQELLDNSEKKSIKTQSENLKIPQVYIDTNPIKTSSKNKGAVILVIFTLLAISAIVWFYLNYEKNQNKTVASDSTLVENKKAQVKKTDTLAVSPSTVAPQPTENKTTISSHSNDYIFVLEDVVEPRASKRFNQLKRFNWPVELTTTDSINYKIIMKFPKIGTDTLRVKDSLSAQNGRKVYIQP